MTNDEAHLLRRYLHLIHDLYGARKPGGSFLDYRVSSALTEGREKLERWWQEDGRVMTVLSEGGDHLTAKEWVNAVKSGGFVDYDGYDRLATKTHESDTFRAVSIRSEHDLRHLLITDDGEGRRIKTAALNELIGRARCQEARDWQDHIKAALV